ncbi:Wzz/FepE/Etk N-terminal domain-containing protein [Chlamydiota bacterium]
MAIKKQAILRDYLMIFFHRKIFFIVPLLICLTIGIVLAFVLPDYYRATTTVLIEDKSFLKAAMKGVSLNSSIKVKLQIIRTEMLSWGNLHLIVKDLGLDIAENIRTERQLEKFIEQIRENTTIRHSGSKGGIDIIQISYDGKDPVLVQKYVNTITDRYIERQLNLQRGDTYGTLGFLKDLVERYRINIKNTEKFFLNYKNANFGELPSSDSFRNASIDLRSYQTKLASLKLHLNVSLQSKKLLEEQLSGEREIVVSELTKTANPVVTKLKSDIQRLQERLEILLMKYTEKHPDVIQTRAALMYGSNKLSKEEERIISGEKETLNPVFNAIKQRIKEIDLDIETIKTQIQGVISLMKEREDMIRRMNVRELEIGDKKRDTSIDKSIYQTLRQKLENVRISQRIEAGEFGTVIEKLDPARRPLWPIRPNKARVILIWAVIGAILGAGCIVLIEFNDHSFSSIEDAVSYLTIPILGAINSIITREDILFRRHRVRLISTFFLSFFISGILIVLLRFRIVDILSL